MVRWSIFAAEIGEGNMREILELARAEQLQIIFAKVTAGGLKVVEIVEGAEA